MEKLFILLAAFSSTSALAIDDYFSECRGNINYEKLVSCAAHKGIEIVNGGYGVADSVGTKSLDAVSPTVLGCINMYLRITQESNIPRGNHKLVMKKSSEWGDPAEFYAYDDVITIPAQTKTIYMEDGREGNYGYYPVSVLDVRECYNFLENNRVSK